MARLGRSKKDSCRFRVVGFLINYGVPAASLLIALMALVYTVVSFQKDERIRYYEKYSEVFEKASNLYVAAKIAEKKYHHIKVELAELQSKSCEMANIRDVVKVGNVYELHRKSAAQSINLAYGVYHHLSPIESDAELPTSPTYEILIRYGLDVDQAIAEIKFEAVKNNGIEPSVDQLVERVESEFCQ